MAVIRFGIIGAGNVGTGTARGDSFIRVLSQFEQARVVAVCDIRRENAERAAALAGAQPFTEIEEFLESGLDAVVICTPVKHHAEQAIAALQRGLHVLSEVPAVHSMEAAAALVPAAAGSSAHYMLAENYRYFDEVELLKRMADAGRFGNIYFAEGEYLHDCKDLWLDEAGRPTWRGESGPAPGYGVYCTHSVGPVLYILDDRVVQVSALANEIGRVVPERPGTPASRSAGWFNFVMLMRTARGSTVRVRVDTVSPRPHAAAYYSLQGDKGSFETWRGLGDASKVWLADEHEPSHCFASAQWHPLADYAARYLPDRLAAGEEAQAGGHGTSEYWMIRDFLTAIERDEPPPIDVYRGLDYTTPGICAVESVLKGGTAMPVPDFREGPK
jgi:predicted dehydrogenase